MFFFSRYKPHICILCFTNLLYILVIKYCTLKHTWKAGIKSVNTKKTLDMCFYLFLCLWGVDTLPPWGPLILEGEGELDERSPSQMPSSPVPDLEWGKGSGEGLVLTGRIGQHTISSFHPGSRDQPLMYQSRLPGGCGITQSAWAGSGCEPTPMQTYSKESGSWNQNLEPGTGASWRFILFIFLKHCWTFLKALFHFFLRLARTALLLHLCPAGHLWIAHQLLCVGPLFGLWFPTVGTIWHLGPDPSLAWGTVLCLGGCLASPLGVHPLDTSGTPTSFHNQNTSRFGQMSPSVEKYCWESHNPTSGWFLFRNHIPAPWLFAVEPRAIIRVLHFTRSDPPLSREQLHEI